MAGLTVSEKTHWKERISKRIDKRVETLVAKEDPTLLQRVSGEARLRALKSLGIMEQQTQLEQIEKEKAQLERREQRLKAEQAAKIRGVSVEEELVANRFYRYDSRVEDAVKTRANALEADILAESDLGKQILGLRAEKDNLLDTVWLATSSSQIKELWQRVNELLELKPTELERKAIEIAPMQEP